MQGRKWCAALTTAICIHYTARQGAHLLFISSRPSSGAEPKARNMRQMKEAPSSVRTPVLSGGTLKNRLPTIRPITIICVGRSRNSSSTRDDKDR